jgi:hypothetical protein
MKCPPSLTFVIAFAFSTALYGPQAAAARTPYDGNWSVSIWTEQGTCDRGYRYELGVENGRVYYRGQGAFSVSGRVSPNGSVRVTVSRGSSLASGSGRLARNSGSGRWSGKSSTSACSGTWEAERR